MKPNKYPTGSDERNVRKVLDHYESQTEHEAVAEDEATLEQKDQTVMDLDEVQQDLLIAVARCSKSLYDDLSRECKDSEILRCFNDRRMKDRQTTLTEAKSQLKDLRDGGYITLRILGPGEVHRYGQDEPVSYRLECKGNTYLSERGLLPVNRDWC